MENAKANDRKTRKFITITSGSLWDQIECLQTLPKYRKSFNKVINDALDFGLEELVKSEFGEVEKPKEEPKTEPLLDEASMQIIRLLKEIVLNVIIDKSLLCSLFNEKSMDLKGKFVDGEKFEVGALRDTPGYLAEFEIRSLKDLQQLGGQR